MWRKETDRTGTKPGRTDFVLTMTELPFAKAWAYTPTIFLARVYTKVLHFHLHPSAEETDSPQTTRFHTRTLHSYLHSAEGKFSAPFSIW